MSNPQKRNNFFDQSRSAFRSRLDYALHPSGNIFLPKQLKGRERALKSMQDCFETPGAHAFIWGPRGVGKTSLGHTACEKYDDTVNLVAAIACEKDTSFNTAINDILRQALHNNKIPLRNTDLSFNLSALGFDLLNAEKSGGSDARINVESVNEAAAVLNSAFGQSRNGDIVSAIIIDEFDLLENRDTIIKLTNLIKQISVDGAPVKFIFCGVASDLQDLLGAHASVERYVYSVELPPLDYEALEEIITDAENEFEFSFHRGQRIRITQISGGYAGFTHLILKNILLEAYDLRCEAPIVTDEIFRKGIHASAEQAATRLKKAYEDAIKKGTDRYAEVLWAVANSRHLDRQFKDIALDYEHIMQSRPHRNGYDTSKSNAQDLRNALNSLFTRKVLSRGRTGWYQFVDPMLRSYVRMIAEREGTQLSDDSFPR